MTVKKSITKQHYLALSMLGNHSNEIIEELSNLSSKCACTLETSKLSTLGDALNLNAFFAGTWHAIAKFEASLPKLASKLSCKIASFRPTHTEPEKSLIYTIQVNTENQAKTLNDLANFLLFANLQIKDLSASTYTPPSTSTKMLQLNLLVAGTNKIIYSKLRDDFLQFCDDHNLDGFLEPYKP